MLRMQSRPRAESQQSKRAMIVHHYSLKDLLVELYTLERLSSVHYPNRHQGTFQELDRVHGQNSYKAPKTAHPTRQFEVRR